MTWNKIKNPIKLIVVIAIVAFSLSQMLPVQSKIHLGLDLQGGSRLLVQLYPTALVPKITSDIQEQTRVVFDRRINSLGVSEPQISNVGSDRILVELPNIKNPDQAEALLKHAAVLEFKIVPAEVAAAATQAQAILQTPNVNAKQKAAAEKYVADTAYKLSGKVVYAGSGLKQSQAGFAQAGGAPMVFFYTKDPAKFAAITGANMGKPLGIFVDKRFVSAPTINGVIADSGEITGMGSQEATALLANELNSGALPATVRIVEKESIGPTLGQVDLMQSLWASMLGMGVVLLFMIFVYRLPGFLADLALVIYVLMMMGLLAVAHATLTLPGIAGFVLSIGMAVDANVLIFERIKEELWHGKSMRAAVRVGFARAFSAVFDSHFTTIVGAGVLYWLGTGTVKGFAFTLFWGTVLSLVTAVFITRFFVDALVDNDWLTKPELYGVKAEDIGTLAKVGA
jgi:preprotein translocase subunit SecD